MTISIKAYNSHPDEVQELRRLAREWHDDFWTFDHLLQTLARRTCHLLFLQVDDVTVGCVLYQLVIDQADIIYVYISPEFRGKHYGLELLKAMEASIRETSQSHDVQLNLEVRHDNEAAKSLYEKFGMSLIRKIPKYYQAKIDAVVYHKVIASKVH
jgi:ribosomal-protein-alanine N-acetyltransferase